MAAAPAPAHVLVVDDDEGISAALRRALEYEGLRVSLAKDGYAALDEIRRHAPDLVVLDLMLPGMNGLEVTRRLRAGGALPIIMLTARGEETDRVVGLELGADDYVTKPFSPRELVARVKAVLRRTHPAPAPEPAESSVVAIGGLRLDAAARAVTLDGQPVNLTVREFDLLQFLMRHPGQVFTREQLLDNVWGYAFASEMSTVTVHIRRLREKIERDPTTPSFLQTVWGVGYKFERP